MQRVINPPLSFFPSPSPLPSLPSFSQDGLSALMVASCNSHDPVVQLLIASKAIIDLKSKKKWTALMYAVHHGHIKVVRALLAARADPTVRDGSGKTAHDLAKEGKQNEILDHLSRHSVAVTNVAVSEWNGMGNITYSADYGMGLAIMEVCLLCQQCQHLHSLSSCLLNVVDRYPSSRTQERLA